MDAILLLRAGCKLLNPIMNQHGFTFNETASGKSAGGYFASGEYIRGDRRLELHFRHYLGLVRYHIGSLSASHESYIQELLGSKESNQYPGFSDDPLDGFRHLAHDLKHFCQDFLDGSGGLLEKAALKESAESAITEKINMADSVGDKRRREEARDYFRRQDYHRVVERLEGLEYPELMTESERKMLKLSRQKLK